MGNTQSNCLFSPRVIVCADDPCLFFSRGFNEHRRGYQSTIYTKPTTTEEIYSALDIARSRPDCIETVIDLQGQEFIGFTTPLIIPSNAVLENGIIDTTQVHLDDSPTSSTPKSTSLFRGASIIVDGDNVVISHILIKLDNGIEGIYVSNSSRHCMILGTTTESVDILYHPKQTSQQPQEKFEELSEEEESEEEDESEEEESEEELSEEEESDYELQTPIMSRQSSTDNLIDFRDPILSPISSSYEYISSPEESKKDR